MKKLVLLLALSVSIQVGYAQTFNEWFRQKKTQLDYLYKQIAALKVYADYLKKGYDIVRDGTKIIGDIKQGDFDLHKGYFSSLRQVNPAIQKYSKAAIILSDQTTILKQFQGLVKFSVASTPLSSAERNYISSVYSHLKSECLQNMEDLAMVMTAGTLEMKDDERVERIDRIYTDMKDKLSFTHSFCKQAGSLVREKSMAAEEINRLRKIYGYQ